MMAWKKNKEKAFKEDQTDLMKSQKKEKGKGIQEEEIKKINGTRAKQGLLMSTMRPRMNQSLVKNCTVLTDSTPHPVVQVTLCTAPESQEGGQVDS